MGNQLSIDIGPFYIQVTTFLPQSPDPALTPALHYSNTHNGTFYFTVLQKSLYKSFKDSPLFSKIVKTSEPVAVTGACYDPVFQQIQQEYEIQVYSQGTTSSTITALEYLWKFSPTSFYKYLNRFSQQFNGIMKIPQNFFMKTQISQQQIYPFLLINLRTGISIYRVDSPSDYKRVGGSNLGGSTYWSLCKLLCGFRNPISAVIQSLRADNRPADLTVGDIYGDDCGSIGLPKDLLASSAGKLRQGKCEDADVAKSLLLMCIFNCTQISFLQAQIEGISNVVMSGNAMFYPQSNMMMQYCMNYWSQSGMNLIFVQQEAFLGSFGSLLKNLRVN